MTLRDTLLNIAAQYEAFYKRLYEGALYREDVRDYLAVAAWNIANKQAPSVKTPVKSVEAENKIAV